MINKTIIFFVMMLYFSAFQAEAKFYECISSEQARIKFQSGEIEQLPNYVRAPFGGARVQEEHPKTYLFAQAKHLTANGKKGAICQYSNHVGVVSTYFLLNMEPVTVVDRCEEVECGEVSHWRSEWTNPLTDDEKKSAKRIAVCVKTISGVEYPSAECLFKSAGQ